MEAQDIFPHTLNLFENEEKSLQNMKNLIFTPVGYNSSEEIDPFHPSFIEIRGDNSFPSWFYEFY